MESPDFLYIRDFFGISLQNISKSSTISKLLKNFVIHNIILDYLLFYGERFYIFENLQKISRILRMKFSSKKETFEKSKEKHKFIVFLQVFEVFLFQEVLAFKPENLSWGYMELLVLCLYYTFSQNFQKNVHKPYGNLAKVPRQ